MKKISIILKMIIFCTILYILMIKISDFMFEYSNSSFWARQNALYEMKKDSIDVALCGSSMLQTSILNLEMYKKYGISSMKLSMSSERIEITYYKIKEMYKRQKPEILIVDLFKADPSGLSEIEFNEHLHFSLDLLRLNFNKIAAINAVIPKYKRLEYIFPVTYYHSNWKLVITNFNKYKKGKLLKNIFTENIYAIKNGKYNCTEGFNREYYDNLKEEIHSTTYEYEHLNPYVEKIIDLAMKNNSKIIFTCTPKPIKENKWELIRFEKVKEIIQNKYNWNPNIYFLNFNDYTEQMNFDYFNDMYDNVHVNYLGAKKTTYFLANYLQNNFNIKPNDKNKAELDESYEEYLSYLQNKLLIENISQIGTYWDIFVKYYMYF